MKHADPFMAVLLPLLSGLILVNILRARRGSDLFIRKIPGIDAIGEAVGRATEMGRPILFSIGLGGIDIVTLLAFEVVAHVTRLAARYRNRVIVPVVDPVAIPVLEEIEREAFASEHRPEGFNADDIRFLSDSQFAYAAGVVGIMHREQVATNFFFGIFAAESLILAETGQHVGAVQVAGTPSALQVPFFIVTCDYTVIGEEYYATTAYISREPVLLGSLVGQDWGKLVLLVLAVVGTLLTTLGAALPTLKPVADVFVKWIGGG
ncbi:MAG: hypothetical protein AUJ96_12085 [Armatimonadetes bacterium CG2_30_66_41]|nr:MAG: hypothetical protein AUJ96_12085 [Armatimonadetes bacterium CG2_30_66_41]